MKKSAFLFIIVAGIFWGTSGLFVNFLAPFGFSSVQMTAARGVFSAISMVIYTFFYDRRLFRANGWELVLYAASGLAMFCTASSYYASMQHTSVATAVVLMYTAPIFVMVYSVMFFGEKLSRLKLCSIVGMLVGCVLVSGIIGGLQWSGFGIFMGFMAGISYSAYNIVTKIQMRRPCHPLTATMYCMVFMAIISLTVAKPGSMAAITLQNPVLLLPMLIGLALCTGVIPYFLYTMALKALPVGTASALGIIEPMAATVFSVLFLREPLPLVSCLGIICILGSVFLLSRSDE
ncbi:MAG: hypothetical protein E7408_05060 [Ruminococcaceae bacterium]|nr:hypothetical protein [Oscillospiraceae bacterium]